MQSNIIWNNTHTQAQNKYLHKKKCRNYKVNGVWKENHITIYQEKTGKLSR